MLSSFDSSATTTNRPATPAPWLHRNNDDELLSLLSPGSNNNSSGGSSNNNDNVRTKFSFIDSGIHDDIPTTTSSTTTTATATTTTTTAITTTTTTTTSTMMMMMMPTTSSCPSLPSSSSMSLHQRRVLSKLDPNSKPFSPRLFGGRSCSSSSSSSSSTAINTMTTTANYQDKIRQIWNDLNAGTGIALLPTPADFPPYGPQNNPELFFSTTTTSTTTTTTTTSRRMKKSHFDDYGLRGLAGIIEDGSKSALSPFSSVISAQDLGFPLQEYYHYYYYNHCSDGNNDDDSTSSPSPIKKRAFQFESPFSNAVLSVLTDFYYVPGEYCHSITLADRLPAPGMQYWQTDLLFFLFYTAVGEALQIIAGSNLFDRGWRFNKMTRTWFARIPNLPPEERTYDFERGTYQYFDVATWSRMNGKFTLYYHELSERIALPDEYKLGNNGSNQQHHHHLQHQQQQAAAAAAAVAAAAQVHAAAQKRKEAAAVAYLRTIKAAMAAGMRY